MPTSVVRRAVLAGFAATLALAQPTLGDQPLGVFWPLKDIEQPLGLNHGLAERSAVDVFRRQGQWERLENASSQGARVVVLHGWFGCQDGTMQTSVPTGRDTHVWEDYQNCLAAGAPIAREFPTLVAAIRRSMPGVRVILYLGPTLTARPPDKLEGAERTEWMIDQVREPIGHVDGAAIDVSCGRAYYGRDPAALEEMEAVIQRLGAMGLEVWREPGIDKRYRPDLGRVTAIYDGRTPGLLAPFLDPSRIEMAWAICGGPRAKALRDAAIERGHNPLVTIWLF
ncbi:hypothetical protein [Botrimarina sp.]|uniref:hypothetical protein n=1 Tax=Botrimarina sp. TaxID=2795802 RepID=UPI0032ED09FC